MSTLVLQSHRHPLPFDWLQRCLDSVQHWARVQGFDYHFLDDALFDLVPDEVLAKTQKQPVIATDIARLQWIQRYLSQGYQRVLWCDADFFIFNANAFTLEDAQALVGRENWIQRVPNKDKTKLKNFKKVHNAFMAFQSSSSLLNYYLDSALYLVQQNQGQMPPQFVGPKLLTALHNVVPIKVQESAGMISPLLLADLAAGNGPTLGYYRTLNLPPLYGANLCSSLVEEGPEVHAVMDRLLTWNTL